MGVCKTGGMIMHTRYVVLFLLLALAPLAWPPLSTAQIAVVPGSSARGEDLFRTKGCIDCHAFNGAGGKIAPDLSQRDERVRTPLQLASAMWNHAPRMWSVRRLLRNLSAPNPSRRQDPDQQVEGSRDDDL